MGLTLTLSLFRYCGRGQSLWQGAWVRGKTSLRFVAVLALALRDGVSVKGGYRKRERMVMAMSIHATHHHQGLASGWLFPEPNASRVNSS